MEWAEELFTLKKSAKKGRRAAAANDPSPTATGSASATSAGSDHKTYDGKPGSGTSITALANTMEADLTISAAVSSAPRPRRIAGWAEEPLKSAGKAGGANAIEQERFGRPIPTQLSPTNDDDDIPHIPDLDDFAADADFTPAQLIASESATGVALEAPAVAVNRVATYEALNSDLLKLGAFASLDGIDLSILTRCLVAEADLDEPDEVWTWDGLFAEVAGDIHGEQPRSADAAARRTSTNGTFLN